jgi:glyoxylase-like metal-dependent hydrolase (beta-lactamase superfamily II)
MVTRRAFLAGAIAAARVVRGRVTTAQSSPTRLILIGTGGGPRPRVASSAAAQVIVSNGLAYVVDCGDGVARQLVFAGVPLTTLRHIFITHHHSDHNADYGNLVLLAWTAGLSTRVDTWEPPPLENMTKLFFEMNGSDISARTSNERRTPLPPLIHPHELRSGGAVWSADNLKVTASPVDHEPGLASFAYRFDARDRSIVISGDTARSDKVVTGSRRRRARALCVPRWGCRRSARGARDERCEAQSEHPHISDVGRRRWPCGAVGRGEDAGPLLPHPSG